MADLSDTLGPSGSGKELKPSIPDPIPSQVLKSEYMEDISKVTSIFYAQLNLMYAFPFPFLLNLYCIASQDITDSDDFKGSLVIKSEHFEDMCKVTTTTFVHMIAG